MRKRNFSILRMECIILLIACVTCFQFTSSAQEDRSISVYQYRRVPEDKAAEFVRRETTYWSKVAEKAVKNKTMSFWALLERVDGYDLPNTSNYLFINTFPDIDKVDTVFGAAEKITGVPLAKMETNSMSITTSEFYLHSTGWQQVADANPMKDFNYVTMIYHNTNYSDSLVALENKYWGPFIKKAMDDKQTPQKAWGNAVILSPSGDNIKFTTVSYDLFKTLQDALMPVIGSNVVYPADALNKIMGLELNRRSSTIYRVIKVVAAN